MACSGCSGGNNNGSGIGITASESARFHTGTVVQTIPDPSATIAVNGSVAFFNGELCETVGAGIPQPPSPISTPLFTFYKVAQSKAVGQCSFGDLAFPQSYDMSFVSPLCGTNHRFPSITAAAFTGIVPPDFCDATTSTAAPVDSHYSATNAPPPAITITATGLSTLQGMPQLNVFNSHFGYVNTVTATSVNGSSATFPFPTTSTGGLLPGDIYGMVIRNANGPAVGESFYTVGGVGSLNAPFGVDAVDITVQTTICTIIRNVMRCHALVPQTSPMALVTLYNTNQLSYGTAMIGVGTHPVLVKAFRVESLDTSDPNSDTTFQITTEPTLALVVNAGSNNVSVVDLLQSSVAASVLVGSQPVALAITLDESKAYVANYGSSSLTEINLSTFTAARTLALAQPPMSVTMDPSGTSLWVGGQGFLSKVDLASFSVVTSLGVSGSVSSLASSVQQNQIVYSLVGNTAFSSTTAYSNQTAPTSTYSVQQLNTTTFGNTGSFNNGASAAPYSSFTMGGTLPNAAITPGGTAISQSWGNGMGITATPTGFVVYDLVNQVEIMRGTTSTPVRAIASDPKNWNVYLTLPDSNNLITVPLPH
jgi:YVTN family beta-propeller protein